ncbi:MAG: translation initiation factor IF-2, partial [Myxococcales bacterium]|nr:translation initiation factor IF-2 [Myxococcales bacterium]
GITQHIGAYQVDVGDSTITFLDTPGHAAFSSMRARGAHVTDIVVLVVAADDGVQPQTAEAIQHAKAAGVPIIVAVNKMDKAGANPDHVKQQLSEYELLPEEWGGDTLYAPVSALRGEGIDELLEQIHLQAEVLDLRANPDRHAEGVVIEAKMERGRGAVASVLVQQGTLRNGDYVVLGSAFGRVRAMVDHRGKRLKQADPSTPVELFGLSELPEVGDELAVVANEKNARKLAEHRAEQKKLIALSEGRRNALEDLYAAAARGQLERLHVILKADVQGTLQAIKTALEKIEVEGTEINVLLAAVGDISESDVNLASSDNAILLGFNVKLDSKARQAADQKGVEPEIFSVIYALLDTVESRLKGMLAPEYEHVLNGTAEVRQLFRISKVGVVAGSYVIDGKVARGHRVKILRDGSVIHEGKITGLKRFKDDVREVTAGLECGVFVDYGDIQEGDLIETYAEEIVEQG